MRTYKLLFILFIFFSYLSSPAQVVEEGITFKSGEKIKKSQRKGIQQLIGSIGTGFYTLQEREKYFPSLRRRAHTYVLQHFDAEMNLTKSRRLKLRKGREFLNFEFMVQMENRLYVFSSLFDEETKTENLFAQEINVQSLKPKAGYRRVASVPDKWRSGYFTYSLSPEKNRLMVLYQNSSGRQEKEGFNLYVLDDEMNLRWQKEGLLPYPDKSFTLEELVVDNRGNVALLSTLFSDNRRMKRDGAPNYQYHLISFTEQGSEFNEYAIRLPGKFLTDIQIEINNQQDIVGGGFYAEENSYRIRGSYFFTIDGRTNEVVSKSVKAFKPEFNKAYLPDRHILNHTSSSNVHQLKLYGYQLNDIKIRSDGSAVLVGEEYMVNAETITRQTREKEERYKTQYHYNYNNILVINADRNGKITWMDKIVKNQHSIGDAGLFSSYIFTMAGDQSYILYNYNHQNKEQQQALSPVSKEKGVMVVRFDKNGNKVQKVMPLLLDKEFAMMPKTALQTGASELVVLGGSKNKHCLIRMTIKPEKFFFAEK